MGEKSSTRHSPSPLRKSSSSGRKENSKMGSLLSVTGFPLGSATARLPEPEPNNGELRNREHFYRELLEALPAAIYMTDTEGRITFYNQASVDLAGRSPDLGTDRWCVS